jgi:dolichyl-phosphate beta-glucosyltransferase
MDLSIVIPVYNEGRKIDKDIRLASQFLENRKLSGEIIISDDGSTDDTGIIPSDILDEINVPVEVIDNKKHKGKGFAVRSGILKARGKCVLFIDSGACVSYDEILKGLDLIKTGKCDIAHGSRFLKDSNITRKKQWYRRLASYLFRKSIHVWIRIPIALTDTQCGLKIYRKDVAHELYGDCMTEGFMFDIEIILLAAKAGYKIEEFPISWTADPDSRLSLINTLFSMVPELRRIKIYINDKKN